MKYRIDYNLKALHLCKCLVDAYNIRWYNNMIVGQGTVITLDARPYVEMCDEFGIECYVVEIPDHYETRFDTYNVIFQHTVNGQTVTDSVRYTTSSPEEAKRLVMDFCRRCKFENVVIGAVESVFN